MGNRQIRLELNTDNAMSHLNTIREGLAELEKTVELTFSEAFDLLKKHQLCLIPMGKDGWFCGKFDYDNSWGGYFSESDGVIDGGFEDGYAVGKTALQAIRLAVANISKAKNAN